MSEEKKQEGLNIELTEEVAEGTYSNIAIINHSPSEFVVDFIQMMPGVPKAKVKSRIIMSPVHLKTLTRALQDNIKNDFVLNYDPYNKINPFIYKYHGLNTKNKL